MLIVLQNTHINVVSEPLRFLQFSTISFHQTNDYSFLSRTTYTLLNFRLCRRDFHSLYGNWVKRYPRQKGRLTKVKTTSRTKMRTTLVSGLIPDHHFHFKYRLLLTNRNGFVEFTLSHE